MQVRRGAAPVALAALAGPALGLWLAVGCGGSSASGDDAAPDAGATDAAAPDDDAGADAAPADAGTDAADAHAPIDAGPRYCTTLTPAPKFCEDWDDGDLSSRWDVKTASGGTMSLDDAVAESLPYALDCATPALGAVESNLSLRKTLFATVNHATLSFSTLLSTTTFTTGSFGLASLDVSLSHRFTLFLRDAPSDATTPGPSLEEVNGGDVIEHPFTTLPPAGVWSRVVIDLDLAGGTATVSFDGAKALDAEPIAAGAGSETTIRIGLPYVVGPIDKLEGHVDDVTLDYQ